MPKRLVGPPEAYRSPQIVQSRLDRVGRPIGRCDPLIAADAIRHSLELVSGNTAHYQRIQQLGYPLTLVNCAGTTSFIEPASESWRSPPILRPRQAANRGHRRLSRASATITTAVRAALQREPPATAGTRSRRSSGRETGAPRRSLPLPTWYPQHNRQARKIRPRKSQELA